MAGSSGGGRRVRGGSFLLKVLRWVSRGTGLGSVAPISGIDGLQVFADFNDERILDVIHEIRGENPEYRVMSALLSPGDTFVDIGANFGTFSLLASRLVDIGGTVIAIEPQPRLAALIVRSLSASGVQNCEVMRTACGTETGKIDLHVPAHDSGRAGMFAAFSGRVRHETISVPVAPLDRMIDRGSITGRLMIKVDVEGSEFGVLEGGRRLIESTRPPLLIELNPWTATAAGRSTSDLIQLLQSLGYQRFATMDSYPDEVATNAIDLSKQTNILALF